jgi:phosphoesterase RecJ-like protein
MSGKETQRYLDKFHEFVEKNDNFIVSGHMSADGDAIASCLGVAEILEQQGKQFDVVFHDDVVDPRFSYLEKYPTIKNCDHFATPRWDAAIMCDTPEMKRLGRVADFYTMPMDKIFRIDHHPGNMPEGIHNWEDLTSSSTAVMVYFLLRSARVTWSEHLAETILSGIYYDTGRFAYRNTKPEDLSAAAEMVSFGAKPEKITKAIFFNFREEALKTFGTGLHKLQSFEGGRLHVIFLNHDDMKNVTSNEIEDLANYAAAVQGGFAGVFMREENPGQFKISLRSRSFMRVDTIARQFDGGGHPQAAGCRIEGNYDDIIEKLCHAFRVALQEQI